MRPFSLLIKPASGDCNLACDYCFYTRKCAMFPETRRHRMSPEVLERLVASYLATPQPLHSFAWQGGEPTLMGLEFYRQVIELQRRHGAHGARVANALQTNATLLDDAFAAFLAEHLFLIGCSLDGPPALHDRYRRHAGGRGSHAEVMRGIDALRRHGAEFNILVLVSRANVAHARDVYRYLVDQGFLYHQYIPCVEFEPDGVPKPVTITAEEWGAFQCELFDAWIEADSRRVSIRQFDSVLSKLVDGMPTQCTMASNCCQYLVVEHNGNVYPCDFFVEPELQLGNVTTDAWSSMLDHPAYRAFGARKREWPAACSACEFLNLCQGDCLKHRVGTDCSHLCAGWKRFFAHTETRFAALADAVRAQRAQSTILMPRASPAAGRNAPCTCGSGRKFKHCCGR